MGLLSGCETLFKHIVFGKYLLKFASEGLRPISKVVLKWAAFPLNHYKIHSSTFSRVASDFLYTLSSPLFPHHVLKMASEVSNRLKTVEDMVAL